MIAYDDSASGNSFQSKNLDLQIIDGVVQKRDHFRLPCSIPIQIRVMQRDEKGLLIPGDPHAATVCNLSGSGLKLLSKVEAKAYDYIVMNFALRGIDMQLVGEIRVKYNTPRSTHPFQYGVMFSGISDADQANIVRFLFQEQTSRAFLG